MLCDEYESVLIWDEVKTGATVAYKGVQGLVDVQPDLLCLGKAIGGGVPIGAVGGRKWVMEVVARGDAPHYGTFSGNPLAVAAGQATLDLLDESAYRQLNAFREKISQPIIDDIAQYNLPLHVDGEGAKGGIFCSNKPASDYRDWQKNTDTRLAQWGWLEMLNARVWGAPGADEQWTLSLGFDQEAVDWYLEAWAGWRDKLRLLPE
jgi:glutamate-1-semialdehyde 2,1-aminomutase